MEEVEIINPIGILTKVLKNQSMEGKRTITSCQILLQLLRFNGLQLLVGFKF
jgi:hypothetical protein